jgi:hypothetical protein
MEIELKPLDQAFEKALELAFREVPFKDRLKATERALEAFRLPEDLVLEVALPGAFHGSIRGVPKGPPYLRFIRYGSVVLKVGENYDAPAFPPALPEGVWAREGLVAPLARPSLWTRYPLPFPRPLLEGVERALASLAKEVGVSPPLPLPEDAVFVGGPARAGDLVLANIGVLVEYDPFDRDLEPRLLVLGPGGALLVDPWSRGTKSWDAWAKALQAAREGVPTRITEETLTALLGGEGGPGGEAVLKALRDPQLFRLLRLARL